MAEQLNGRRVAALVAHGFEQAELLEPKKALEAAGARVDVVSPEQGEVKGWNHTEWGERVKVDRKLEEARPQDYDALLLPGGVMNPDKLRMNTTAVEFVKQFARVASRSRSSATGPGRWSKRASSAAYA